MKDPQSLRVGDFVLVDAAAADLPSPFAGLVVCQVDMILSDPLFVSVRAALPGSLFSGSIRRSAIVKAIPPVPGAPDFRTLS